MTRRQLLGAAAILSVAFLIVLAVPPGERGLALLAFALLAGALAVLGAVTALASVPAATDEFLGVSQTGPDQRPGDLEAIESDVREALERGRVDDRLGATLRSVASALLARNHRIDLATDPQAAHRVLGDGLTWLLLTRARSSERVRPAELAAVVEELERL
jgi:hypothetical protein